MKYHVVFFKAMKAYVPLKVLVFVFPFNWVSFFRSRPQIGYQLSFVSFLPGFKTLGGAHTFKIFGKKAAFHISVLGCDLWIPKSNTKMKLLHLKPRENRLIIIVILT